MKIPAIINYFQDCTTENSETAGAGYRFLKGRHRAWILNSWQVEIFRRPEVRERIRVSTWATDFKGVFGPRDFQMCAENGEVLARAHSLWVYINTENGRPVRPTEDEVAFYELGAPLAMESVSRKISVPEGAIEVDTFPVRKYHIDTNHHVNNSRYIEIACETVPEDFSVRGLRVEYKKAAVYGERMMVKQVRTEKILFAELCGEDGNPYAVVEFTGEKKR